ncbi:MAG: hypothetical protein ACYTG7_08735 [Planctomycetota bacterium]|jgi:hypothetical protein
MGLSIRAFFVALFAALKRWKIIFFFFLLNLLFSLLPALPLFKAISADGGHYNGLQGFLENFNPEALADFTRQNSDVISAFFLTAGLAGIIYFLLYNIFTGGLIAIVGDPRERTTMRTFLQSSGRFSFRFLRLMFYFIVFLVILAYINRILDGLLLWYFTDFLEYGAGSATLGWVLFAKGILMLLLLGYGILSFNYAKTVAVVEDRHFMGGSFLRGMGFVVTHPLVTGLFFFFAGVLLLILVYAYGKISRTIDPAGSYTLLDGLGGITLSGALLAWIFGQVIQLLIQGCLVVRHAGQVYIFKYLTVQETRPDPELTQPDPYSPFIADSPDPGPNRDKIPPDMEEGHSHA